VVYVRISCACHFACAERVYVYMYVCMFMVETTMKSRSMNSVVHKRTDSIFACKRTSVQTYSLSTSLLPPVDLLIRSEAYLLVCDRPPAACLRLLQSVLGVTVAGLEDFLAQRRAKTPCALRPFFVNSSNSYFVLRKCGQQLIHNHALSMRFFAPSYPR
jgi:hypothetical protein